MALVDVHIGTYTEPFFGIQGRGAGIHHCRVDTDVGRIFEIAPPTAARNPSYLALSPDERVLFAVSEVEARDGPLVSSFARTTNGLTKVCAAPVEGGIPCHLAVDPTGRWLATAHYETGDIEFFLVRDNGGLSRLDRAHAFAGSGPNAARQESSHVHYVSFLEGGKKLAVVDLGSDQVFIFAVALSEHDIDLNRSATLALPAGSGPRHLASAADGRVLFVMCELRETISVYKQIGNEFVHWSTMVVFPDSPTANGAGAAIRLSPDGRHLYASFRRQACIVGVASRGCGVLDDHVQDVDTGGLTPRDFAISPDGRCLVVANQESDLVTTILRDPVSGHLTPTRHAISIGNPACVCMAHSQADSVRDQLVSTARRK